MKHIDDARAFALWNSGVPYVDIEIEFDASRPTIWKAIKRFAGVGSLTEIKRAVTPAPAGLVIDPVRAADMRAAGSRKVDIARRFGASRSAVTTHFKRRAA